MRLFIAEKPSMAREIAGCLPKPCVIKDGYIETGAGIVTWCFGHVLRQAEPDEYNEKYKKWNVIDLPIIPDKWLLIVSKSCKKQFGVLKSLIGKTDEIIHAGDPDREGQLLVDEVIEYLGCKKPVKRLLLQALDEKSINKSLGDIRDNSKYKNLKYSALARSRADWLVGMNLSRAFTLAAKKAGHSNTFPVGRVKTPTIALVVRRERELEKFKAVDYYSITAQFKHPASEMSFLAKWQPIENQAGLDSEGRLISGEIAADIKGKLFSSISDKARVTSCQSTDEKEQPPLPFSLSALQIFAGKKYGYDPQTVLDTAQALYEKKLTTYPRSDCEYLPENLFTDAEHILRNLTHFKNTNTDLATWSISGASVHVKSRAWNDSKITAHHAIIPTIISCDFDKLSDTEKDIYFLIAQSFLAQFYAPFFYKKTVSEISCAGENFRVTGKIVLRLGWKALYLKDKDDDEAEDAVLLPSDLKAGDALVFENATADKKATKPPSRYTASGLLAAMKSIHSHVKNPDLKKRLKDAAGIGTEATRAGIIKEIITKGFLKENKKHLIPTEAACVLIDSLPDDLTYPDTTALWEMNFDRIVEGNYSLDTFLQEQTVFVTNLCKLAASSNITNNSAMYCPKCKEGNLIKRTYKRNGKNTMFWGCNRYPDCRATYDDKNNAPQI